MKKYKYILILVLIIFIMPNFVMGQTTEQNQNTACNNKSNGQDCSYKVQLSGRDPETADTPGKCDRRGDGRLYCNNTLTGWEDCFNKSQPNDACKNSSGQSGTCQRQGSGDNFTCDTTGTAPDGSSGGGASGGAPDGASGVSGGTTNATSPQTVSFINPSRFNSIIELVAGIINALLGILGAITVAVLVLSGFKYMTSSNPGEVGAALDGIKNAIVGLMIVMGAFLITQYVISALAGSSTAPTTPTTNPSTTPTTPNSPGTPGTTLPTTPRTPTTPGSF